MRQVSSETQNILHVWQIWSVKIYDAKAFINKHTFVNELENNLKQNFEMYLLLTQLLSA